MKIFFRNNGLSVVLFSLFLIFLAGQSYTGWHEHNDDNEEHGQPQIGFGAYLRSSHFVEATMENWESEFLQMAAYVVFTAFLFQKGSSESKKPGEKAAVDADPRESRNKPGVPWPVQRGGWVLKVYENSLSITFLLLFLFAFSLHAAGGFRHFNEEQSEHGKPPVPFREYIHGSRFWFESFQNWQSEFLAIGSMVVLSIFLRQRSSPESKPVAAPHSETED